MNCDYLIFVDTTEFYLETAYTEYFVMFFLFDLLEFNFVNITFKSYTNIWHAKKKASYRNNCHLQFWFIPEAVVFHSDSFGLSCKCWVSLKC